MDKRTARKLIREAQTIKAKLAEAGWTLLDIDRHYKLPRGTAGAALRFPHKGGEEAIARALGVAAHTLWTERYDQHSGLRHEPQPRSNYRRLPTMRERRKFTEAQT